MARYTMEQLSQKYGGFAAPTAQVTLGGVAIASHGWRIKSVECSTGTGMDSGVCTVTLTGVYDLAASAFLCEDTLIRGTPVTAALGYVVTEPVFAGFLYEVEYELDARGEPTVTLICMDVKAAMMGGGVLDFSGGMTYKEVINSFFTGKNARGYSVLCAAPPMSQPELDQPVSYLPAQMDDYDFLAFTTRRFGLECFVSDGALLLREKPASPEELLAVTPADGVERVAARLRSAGYVKSVSVLGGNDDERDGEKKHASGKADNPLEIASRGSDAGRLIGARRLELFAANVRDDSAAAALAKGQLRQRQTFSSELELTLRGIPALKPGFALTVGKVSPKINGSWYIVSVSHRMEEHSFRTVIQARREL